MLKVQNIHYHIGHKQILKDISLEFCPGAFNIILGPNGSGKSSLLKIFSGETRDYTGNVWYDETNCRQFKNERLATIRAVMSQLPELSFPLTVEEVVMMGRYPHFSLNPGKKDRLICAEAMESMDVQMLKERNYLTLSGGEKQRVQFARVLAQIWEEPQHGCRYLFLDEPISSLDIHYQHQFLQIAKQFTGSNTVLVAIIHDINLAIQYADKLFFMKDGTLLKEGSPSAIINPALIREVFNISVKIIESPEISKPFIMYDFPAELV